MLLSLRIENFAIVKALDLDFSAGMTAFTGETGAGKSIIIDALTLLMGGRADSSVIRPGEEKCDLSALFQIETDSPPFRWLEAHDLAASEGEILLRRVLYAEGRSKSYINGQLFPLQKVKILSQMLVHIHGQHEHQALLETSVHRQHLDHFAHHAALLIEVGERYKCCQQIKEQLHTLQKEASANNEAALLQFQIEELSALNLQPHEMERLSEEHQLLHHARDYLQHIQSITQILDENESAPSVNRLLHQVLNALNHLPATHAAVKNASELINQAIIVCEEAMTEMQAFAEKIPLDESRLQFIEERMSALHQISRKYQVKADELHALLHNFQEKLKMLQNINQQKSILEKNYVQALEAYQQAVQVLRHSRQQAAGPLGEEITAIIQQLGMPKGQVALKVSALETSYSHGQDKVEYVVCTNPGMQPDVLSKIASGGELSRISLAIHMVTAKKGATPTLIFDEVDTGISGTTAALVGRLLRQLGERLQVFCVTHQPQVASAAHHQFRVRKKTQEQHTFSDVIAMSTPERMEEIARMLGGLTISEQTRLNAQALLAEFE